MPTYDYKCDECETVVEKIHPITEDPEFLCPENEDHGPMHRMMGHPDVMFKGRHFTCHSSTKQAINRAAKQARREGMDV